LICFDLVCKGQHLGLLLKKSPVFFLEVSLDLCQSLFQLVNLGLRACLLLTFRGVHFSHCFKVFCDQLLKGFIAFVKFFPWLCSATLILLKELFETIFKHIISHYHPF